MRKSLVIAALLCTPHAAYAGFAMQNSAPSQIESDTMTTMAAPADISPAAGAEDILPKRLLAQQQQQSAPMTMNVATISRNRARPSLEIINERFVPAEIEKKYAAPVNDTVEPQTDVIVSDAAPAPAAQPAEPEKTAIRTMVVTAPDAPAAPAPTEAIEVSSAPMPLNISEGSSKSLVIEDKIKKPVVPVPAERYATWRARKGELMSDVLKRWAERSNVDFMWSAAESPKIADDFSYIGNFEAATAKLMEKNPSQLNMKFEDSASQTNIEPMAGSATLPVTLETRAVPADTIEADTIETASVSSDFIPMTRPSANPMVVPDQSIDDMSALVPTASGEASDFKSFYAAKGSSLKDVMETWAETENARLIWQTADQFTVKDSLNDKQGYESAVSRILTSFDGEKQRPVGQLFKNPVTGEKVLVIRSDIAG